MKNVPKILLFSRLALAPIILVLAYVLQTHSIWFVVIIAWAIISDIFDGIIARKIGVATEWLRRWDSRVDSVFWISATISICVVHLDIVRLSIARSFRSYGISVY